MFSVKKDDFDENTDDILKSINAMLNQKEKEEEKKKENNENRN